MNTNAAIDSRRRHGETRLLVIDRNSETVSHAHVRDLSRYLQAGDRLVVNDAATMPASLHGVHARTNELIEIRLLSPGGPKRRWRAVIFGGGDWRTPTENRRPPPAIREGDELVFSFGFTAKVDAVLRTVSERLLDIEFNGSVLEGIYRAGRPIQYSYLREELAPWDQQTLFSGPPVALEPPSASFALRWQDIFTLRARGVEVLNITHGTGVSDTGDPAINALLPMPEFSHVSEKTELALQQARREKARVIAVGTGVVRALESWARKSASKPGAETAQLATLRIGPATKLEIASGILTGMHDPGASHLDLLSAWHGDALLRKGYAEAQARGYLWHEYGDQCLVI